MPSFPAAQDLNAAFGSVGHRAAPRSRRTTTEHEASAAIGTDRATSGYRSRGRRPMMPPCSEPHWLPLSLLLYCPVVREVDRFEEAPRSARAPRSSSRSRRCRPKYASWVVEAEGYLIAVNQAFDMHARATAELAAALGVEANADAIADFIRRRDQGEDDDGVHAAELQRGLVGECSASANARAAGNAGNGGASGQASAGIQANCQAPRPSLSMSPGGCTMKTDGQPAPDPQRRRALGQDRERT